MNPELENITTELKYSLGAGPHKIDGFLSVDLDTSQNPDEVMDVRNLTFRDGSIDVLYASHVLEHLFDDSYSVSRWEFIANVLRNWRRCLKPTGRLYVCVPNFSTLAKVISDHQDIPAVQKSALDAIYGGSRNKFDHHYAGFTSSLLEELLISVGFASVSTFEPFVNDESKHTISSYPISLNLLAFNSPSPISDDSLKPVIPNSNKDTLSELEIYKRSADERMAEIVAVKRSAEERMAEIVAVKRSAEERMTEIVSLKRITTELRDQLITKEAEIDMLSAALAEIRANRTLLNAEIIRLREMLAHEKGVVKVPIKRPLWKKFLRWTVSK